jgi:hypothetical protein
VTGLSLPGYYCVHGGSGLMSRRTAFSKLLSDIATDEGSSGFQELFLTLCTLSIMAAMTQLSNGVGKCPFGSGRK